MESSEGLAQGFESMQEGFALGVSWSAKTGKRH